MDFSHFNPLQGDTLAKETSSACEMEIKECGDLRWIVSKDGVLHGAMSINQPNNPVLPYIRSMLVAQHFSPDATRVLNLGMGTGAIERFLGEVYPEVKLTSVEISNTRVEQTKRFFGLPSTSAVVVKEASEYLKQCRTPQDIIYCDLFDTRDNFNRPLSHEFISDLWETLKIKGWLLSTTFLNSRVS